MQLQVFNDPGYSWPYKRVSGTDYGPSYDTLTSRLGGFSVSTPWDANDEAVLIARLKEAILGSDFNLGIFLGEAPKSFMLIFESARRLAAALRAARKGNLRGTLEHLGITRNGKMQPNWGDKRASIRNDLRSGISDAAKANLIIEYGWLPLIGDLQAGAQMLAHLTECPQLPRVRAKKRRYGTIKLAAPSYEKYWSYEKWCATSVTMVAFMELVDFARLVGLTDFESVAWEAAPWSFVCDWVLPIGQYLDAMSVQASLRGTFVRTAFVNYGVTNVKGASVGPDNSWHISGGIAYEQRFVSVDRTVSTSLVVPKPQFRSPGESWRRAKNAVSLLIGLSAPRAGHKRDPDRKGWENESSTLRDLFTSLPWGTFR
jgi:hypothetical protein